MHEEDDKNELVHIIIDYLTSDICNHVSNKKLSFHWSYRNGQFSISFKLAEVRFFIIANTSGPKDDIGMRIIPLKYGIRIICYNYIDNFKQVVNILGEIENELISFEKIFPTSYRRKFIRDNFSLLTSSNHKNNKSKEFNFNVLSNKYLLDHNLIDDYGAKEIALDYLLSNEYHYKIKTPLKSSKSK
ncbi:MAG: hypothetical protein HDS01_05125 [Bacteroides sp.]|nr:hypothetical protein [Bacteroides sp.]